MNKRHKIHLEIWDVAPNESDPAGQVYSVCGREYFENGTTWKECVTCKQCLKVIKKDKDQ